MRNEGCVSRTRELQNGAHLVKPEWLLALDRRLPKIRRELQVAGLPIVDELAHVRLSLAGAELPFETDDRVKQNQAIPVIVDPDLGEITIGRPGCPTTMCKGAPIALSPSSHPQSPVCSYFVMQACSCAAADTYLSMPNLCFHVNRSYQDIHIPFHVLNVSRNRLRLFEAFLMGNWRQAILFKVAVSLS